MEDIPRFIDMPDCVYRAMGQLRIYRVKLPGSIHGEQYVDTLEMIYRDGNDNQFWGPVPIVMEEE